LPEWVKQLWQKDFPWTNVAAYWNRYGREIEAVEVAMAAKAGP